MKDPVGVYLAEAALEAEGETKFTGGMVSPRSSGASTHFAENGLRSEFKR